ncbi:MAG TPA: isoaspartyl peptidase/L-asparaginase [Gemmatimonadaceae bacterium]|nr:isoaspartyl peptidase/L-asparaginase [Gemmatimonadaceae bacterium]
MRETISRREFLLAGAAVPVLGARIAGSPTFPAPAIIIPKGSRPCVVASDNGIRGVKVAYDMLMKGADTLDAIIAGVNIQELDPEDQSVGLGGLPNEEGVVQLDASCMHGPTRRAGAVGALEGIATPSLVARAVMEYTDHMLLVGKDARRFALSMGFKEQNLLTDKSKAEWLKWKATRAKSGDGWINDKARENWLRWNAAQKKRTDEEDQPLNAALWSDKIAWTHGTINMNAVAANGDLSSCTSTSGRSWKIPGRVGDSPIIGAGQYCDNDVGAAGSTGRGEANMKVCGAFLTVEGMRRGLSPTDACLETLRRVVATTEPRLLNQRGRPKFGLAFYAVNKRGEFGGAILSDNYPFVSYAVADASGARLVELAAFYDGTAELNDALVRRREIKLDPATLDRFVGEYAVPVPIVITKENGSLWAQPAGNRRAQLFAEAPTEFFLKIADMQLSFVVNPAGTVTGLVVHLSGLDQTGRKYRYDWTGRKVR